MPARTVVRGRPVSIHAPARGATCGRGSRVHIRGAVSIHAPARGATLTDESTDELMYPFQSTLPRGERRDRDTCTAGDSPVSIHAPARGATGSFGVFPVIFQVSIHAPARGATLNRPFSALPSPVSIHAPARGATDSKGSIRNEKKVSIHAPARGATGYLQDVRLCAGWFQSTLPRGERLDFW